MVDAIVVGAGPAGSACALRLARAGIDVTIVERSAFPRTKVCGEYLNLGALAELDALDLRAVVAEGAALQGIRLFGLGLAVDLPLRSAARAMPRSVLDARLLDAARAAGATLLHARVEDVTCDSERARIRARDSSGEEHTLDARVVVAADGMDSIVARKCGLLAPSRGRERFAVGGHFGGFRALDRFVEMYVDRGSYFAVNPLGSGEANIMVVVAADVLSTWRGAIDVRLREAAARLSGGRRTFAGVAQIGKRVAIGPLAHRTSRLVGTHVLLVGDAGEFVDPFTGQGIFLALAGARRASEAVIAVLRDRVDQREAFARYETQTRHETASRRRLARTVKFVMSVPLLARRAARNLERLPDLGPTIMDSVAGAVPAARAYAPATLARLLA
ncbi:MAG TPA: FAD-dependent oxidoreductase [Candidatus Baltobacteraceae bacterium]|jgi:geranylgeranyl reductase family protein